MRDARRERECRARHGVDVDGQLGVEDRRREARRPLDRRFQSVLEDPPAPPREFLAARRRRRRRRRPVQLEVELLARRVDELVEGEVGCFVHHGFFAASAPRGLPVKSWAVFVFIFAPRRRCVVTRAAARSLLVQKPAGQFLPSRPPQQLGVGSSAQQW